MTTLMTWLLALADADPYGLAQLRRGQPGAEAATTPQWARWRSTRAPCPN